MPKEWQRYELHTKAFCGQVYTLSADVLVLVLEAAFTQGRLSRHHQGRTMVIFHGYLAHRGTQSRRRCIYWLCSSSQVGSWAHTLLLVTRQGHKG